jgi:hypothetical protein
VTFVIALISVLQLIPLLLISHLLSYHILSNVFIASIMINLVVGGLALKCMKIAKHVLLVGNGLWLFAFCLCVSQAEVQDSISDMYFAGILFAVLFFKDDERFFKGCYVLFLSLLQALVRTGVASHYFPAQALKDIDTMRPDPDTVHTYIPVLNNTVILSPLQTAAFSVLVQWILGTMIVLSYEVDSIFDITTVTP